MVNLNLANRVYYMIDDWTKSIKNIYLFVFKVPSMNKNGIKFK